MLIEDCTPLFLIELHLQSIAFSFQTPVPSSSHFYSQGHDAFPKVKSYVLVQVNLEFFQIYGEN